MIAFLLILALADAPQVSPFDSSIVVGSSVNLDVRGGSGNPRWASSDPSIATVTRSGVVTGKAAGTVTITVKRGNQEGRASVTVVASEPAPDPGRCAGAVHRASSWDDVLMKHAFAADGDTIRVAAGVYTVTRNTPIEKAICLEADGVVTLTDNTANDVDLLTLTESAAGSIVVEGFTIQQGSSIDETPASVLRLVGTPNGQPIVVTGNTYTAGSSANFLTIQTNRGVIAQNTMTAQVWGPNCLNQASFIRHKIPGAPTWGSPAVYGAADVRGDQAVYIEANTLRNVAEGIDVDDNARAVIRRNTLSNSAVMSHGSDTSFTGARLLEVYDNTFIRDLTLLNENGCTASPMNNNGWIALRGGTGVIFGNSVPDIGDGWWGDKSEVVFFVEQLRRNAGAYACWSKGYPVPQQTGWGFTAGGTMAGPIAQDLEPIYLWGNTGSGNHESPLVANYAPNECGDAAPSATDYLQRGREFHVGTAKPGYVPYPYPHPLAERQ